MSLRAITGQSPVSRPDSTAVPSARPRLTIAPPAQEEPSTRVSLSANASTGPDEPRVHRFRPEVVAAIKKEIAAGTFGGKDDTERAVDALLGEMW